RYPELIRNNFLINRDCRSGLRLDDWSCRIRDSEIKIQKNQNPVHTLKKHLSISAIALGFGAFGYCQEKSAKPNLEIHPEG
ncbi:hypothetical protein OAL00_07780, partial [Verrucomicrobiales bacterium]|nr:hypothetical protein [Verrucomicrobiales bacterium]